MMRCTACGDLMNDEAAAEAHEIGEHLEGDELEVWLEEGHEVERDEDEDDDPFAGLGWTGLHR